MRNNLLPKILITAALLILAIPVGASAQIYRDRSYNRYDNRDQYDRYERRQVREAIRGLDNSAARLESDLNVSRGRRVLGVFWVGASAQIYRDRSYVQNRDQYDRSDRRMVREAIRGLDNSAARLESDLSVNRGRRVLGIFWVGNSDSRAVAEVRDFRRAVRQLRSAANNGRDLRDSYDEARMVLDQGMRLDRYLRVRTGSAQVDADLSELRSNLHLIADAYNLRLNY